MTNQPVYQSTRAGTRRDRSRNGRSPCMFVTLLLALAVDAAAVDVECLRDAQAARAAFHARIPADPNAVQSILTLRREGERLCHRGATDSGRAKLREALSLLAPESASAARDKRPPTE
ncbi:MAG: hypothetical protein U1E83_00240 [Methylotetracoccus sp.]